MPKLSQLNLEQSVARYLADRFKEANYNILWKDTGQQESVGGDYTVTLVKRFPQTPADFVNHGEIGGATSIQVPAFTVFSDPPTTTPDDRQGIGSGVFQWEANLTVDGFADNEQQWYLFKNLFTRWFHVDSYVDLYDYESDLMSSTPPRADGKIYFTDLSIMDDELQDKPAVRYYINIGSTAIFVE